MSNLSQFGAGVKSVQHIAGSGSATATISSVNTSKTVIVPTGTNHSADSTKVVTAKYILTSGTEVTVTAGGDVTAAYLRWAADVVEFY